MTDEGPRRTCVGCRSVRPKAQMVRLARRATGEVIASGTAPGRGAYVCRDPACVARAMKPGRLAQAFRKPSHAGADLAATGGAVPTLAAGTARLVSRR